VREPGGAGADAAHREQPRGDHAHADRTLRQRVEQLVLDELAAAGIEHERGARPGEVVAILPGEHKLRTTVSLLVGDHSLSASAFVVRHPDENEPQVLRWLLRRNSRLHGVAFAVDDEGDVYLVGRLPLSAVTPDELDRLLGAVLTYADDNFDTMLRLGFGDSIKREWAWRVKRGESLANLRAFARFADPGAD
jgi:hypothetical protein